MRPESGADKGMIAAGVVVGVLGIAGIVTGAVLASCESDDPSGQGLSGMDCFVPHLAAKLVLAVGAGLTLGGVALVVVGAVEGGSENEPSAVPRVTAGARGVTLDWWF